MDGSWFRLPDLGASRESWRPALLGLLLTFVTPAASQTGRAPATTGAWECLKAFEFGAAPLSTKRVNKPLIQGSLSGRKAMLLVDSGSRWTLLSRSEGKHFKTLGQLGVTLEDSLFGAVTNPSVVLIEKLGLGQAVFFNQPARVENLRLDYVGTTFDGILGLDFLVRNHCLLDCTAWEIYFRSRPLSTAEATNSAARLERAGFKAVPMEFHGRFSVHGRINGQPVRLMVDSGAHFTLLDAPQAQKFNLELMQERAGTGSLIPRDLTGHVVGAGGARELRAVRAQSLQLGPVTLAHQSLGIVHFEPSRLQQYATPGETLDGLLGIEILVRTHALIDFEQRKLWVKQ